LQADEWPWLARGLTNLRVLKLQNVRLGTNNQWPAALADCTRLTELHLLGKSAPPLPDGRYLSRLQTISWLSERYGGALPEALANSSNVRMLVLGVKPGRRTNYSMLETFPNLKDVLLVCHDNTAAYAHDFLQLKQRFSDINAHREYVCDGWHQVL